MERFVKKTRVYVTGTMFPETDEGGKFLSMMCFGENFFGEFQALNYKNVSLIKSVLK